VPELPEIETIRRDLADRLTGDTVINVDVLDSRLMSKKETARWTRIVVGHPWANLGRRGKYLWAKLANDWRVVFHMRMTGQMIVQAGQPKPGARLLLYFKSGKVLGLYDQRRFAEAWLLSPEQAWHTDTPPGPDALTELKREQFVQLLKGRTTRIQPLLMDQRLIAGVGNIYAQEALFKAAIRPTRPGFRVTKAEAGTLFDTLRETLVTAIEHRGSSSRNYLDASGQKGSAQRLHAVYRKGGTSCPRCQGDLRSIRVGGRGSVFCPRCQK